jgi:hypothetical protein
MRKNIVWLEGSVASPACPSDNSSIHMKTILVHWWNESDREGNDKFHPVTCHKGTKSGAQV